MRIATSVLAASIGSGLIAALAGCSGNGSPGAPNALPDATGQQASQVSSPAFAAPIRAIERGGKDNLTNNPPAAVKYIAVGDLGSGSKQSTVAFLDRNYGYLGSLSNGVGLAYSVSYDSAANLYVANASNNVVQEYAPGGYAPKFTYSSGLSRPDGIATDASGNVYVSDRYDTPSSLGSVFEYAQGSNSVLTRCSNGLDPLGVTVDKQGNVFVSGVLASPYPPTGVIFEYSGGLGACNPTPLGVTLGTGYSSGGGLLFDNNGNMIVANERHHEVDIIPPPYTAIGSSITGFESPRSVALNKSQTLLFVADPNNYNIQVLTYPGGTYVTMLDDSNGLHTPSGVAAYPTK